MIPLVDLKAQYRSIEREVRSAVDRVLESGQFVLGSEVAAFEEEFARYCEASHAIGVNSGTSALHLALLAAGVGPGDEVITTPFTFVATAAAVRYVNAIPVFVDIDPVTFNIDAERIEAAITPRTKAILPVHLYGQTAAMGPILEVARRYNLVVIEDACQAHGSEYDGKRAGSLGDIACFSFYPGKNLGAYGEGGALTTDNPQYARRLRMLRDWGAERKYLHEVLGFNYRLDELQAAILRIKLARLEEWTESRREAATRYGELLAGGDLELPVEAPRNRHVYHVYVVRTDRRSELQKALSCEGVQSGIHYPIPLHLQPAMADLGHHAGDLPNAERAAEEVLSLPMYPELTFEQQEFIARTATLAVGERKAW